MMAYPCQVPRMRILNEVTDTEETINPAQMIRSAVVPSVIVA